jgi:8-oxo-dGTP pyrophosphatase MutT (NUDIX family)
MADGPAVIPQPAATVVLMRDSNEQLEVLLVRRSAGLEFLGGAWVFPGGRIDPEDYLPEAPADDLAAARRAAIREAAEEAGLTVEEEQLILLSRWIAPEGLPKRFDARFFVARGAGEAVCVDGVEIHEHRWMQPAEALAAQRAGEIMLAPPTFVTLIHLSQYQSVGHALSIVRSMTAETFNPRIRAIPQGACSLYAGDAAYEGGDLETPGPRHRLWILGSDWRYERTD